MKMQIWTQIDKYLAKYLASYKKEQSKLYFALDSMVKTFGFTDKNIYKKATNKNISKFKSDIEDYLESEDAKKDSFSYFTFSKLMKRKTVTNVEMLEYYTLLLYNMFSDKVSKLDNKLFNSVAEDSYKRAVKESEKIEGKKEITPVADILAYILADKINNLGYKWSDYSDEATRYNSNEMYRSLLIDISNDKYTEPNKTLLERQLNINGKKHSGAIENEVDFIYNQIFLEVGKEFGIEKAKFIAIEDKVTTKMCSSLDDQVFYLEKENKYKRYSEKEKGVIEFTSDGLITGENLPPITDHYHYCRSSITFII
jgi:hypothetical protein